MRTVSSVGLMWSMLCVLVVRSLCVVRLIGVGGGGLCVLGRCRGGEWSPRPNTGFLA